MVTPSRSRPVDSLPLQKSPGGFAFTGYSEKLPFVADAKGSCLRSIVWPDRVKFFRFRDSPGLPLWPGLGDLVKRELLSFLCFRHWVRGEAWAECWVRYLT